MAEFHFETELLLNMQMLEDNLLEIYNISYYRSQDNRQFLSGACLYHGQQNLLSDVVYVGRAETFDKYPIADGGIPLICIGPSSRGFSANRYAIEMAEYTEWETIFNRVQEIFLRYAAFSHNLFHILNNNGGLYELSVAALHFFGNPLYIHDENFNVLALPMWVVGMTKFVVDETTGNTTVPLEKVHHFMMDPEYRRTMDTHGAHLWNPASNTHRVIYVNIWSTENVYMGRLLINELNSSLKPSDFTMAEYFVRILSLAVERNQFKTASLISFEHILLQMIEGETVSPDYLKERMRMIGWRMGDQFLLCKTVPDSVELNVLSIKKICSIITTTLPHCFSFSHGNEVYSIVNLSLANWDGDILRKKMVHIAQNTESVTGISLPFQQFTLLPEYAKQAGKAVEMGKARHSDERVFHFSAYVLDYILGHFQEEFSARSICSEAVWKLLASDREKGTDYLRTLKAYFDNNYQPTAAAAALFIHRSTLSYRLEKIAELTGADINDPDTRLYLQISMRLVT